MKYLITIMLIFFHLTVNGAIKAHLVNDKVKEFIKTRCLDCHNAKKQKGDVRLDNLAALIDDNGTAQLWQDVLDVINVGDMPPEDEDQPKHEELATFVGHLTDDLVIARKMLSSHGGQILMRRLNQFEYINTIEELTGVRLPESLVPEDPVGEGFNTQGEAQFFSQGMLERYSEAAEYALSRTIGARNVPYNKKKNIIINKAKAENLRMKKAIDAAVKEHQKALKVPKGTTDFKKYGFPNKGKYLAHLKDPQKRIKLYFSYQNHQLNQKGVVLWHNHTRDIKGGFKADSRAKYKIKINIAAENGLADEDKYISFYCGNMFIETFYVSGKIDKPQVIEIDYKPPFNFHKRTVPFDFRLLTNRISAPREKKFLAKNETPPGIWVGDIEIDGPFYSGEIKERANKILGGRDPNTISDSEVKELLNKFAQRAFRGKVVEGAYLDYLMKAYQVELAHSKNKGATLIKSLATILTSPQFLYLGEESTGKKRYVNETEMAHRISYMLLKRPAPKELISGEGKLTKDKHFFLAQINSLIKNPEFGTFIEEFFSQWLELYKYDILDVNGKKYPQFDASLKSSAKQQVFKFIKYVIINDLSLTNLIDSDFTILDSKLSAHYGFPLIKKNGFYKMPLSEKFRYRGGLLGMTAFHTLGSTGIRTAPVDRGAFISKKFLNYTPPPPPPNVAQLDIQNPKLTVRQRLEKHKEIPQCYSCHKKIDDLGFAMENFNTIGVWRDKENKIAIDASGLMPGGGKFNSYAEMKRGLLKQKDKMIRSLIEALIKFGMGREMEFTDQGFVNRLVTVAQKNDYRFKPILMAFIISKEFRTK